MKFVVSPILLALVLGACGPPRAILVENAAETPTPPTQPGNSDPAVASEPMPLPNFGPDDGLLDPKGIDTMPSEREMRSTHVPEPGAPVIATPPRGSATNE